MNIREKSILLAKAMGWEVDEETMLLNNNVLSYEQAEPNSVSILKPYDCDEAGLGQFSAINLKFYADIFNATKREIMKSSDSQMSLGSLTQTDILDLLVKKIENGEITACINNN